jgi:hypothetical protein
MGLLRKIQMNIKATLHRVKCERCLDDRVAEFVVSSDIVHIKVCFGCAEEARRIGLTVKHNRHVKSAA